MKNIRGFTLVEIIVVILIMAILAALSFPVVLSYVSDALNAKYIQQAQSIYSVLQVEQARYAIDNNLASPSLTYQDESVNEAIITQVNDQLKSELNLNTLAYYSEADIYKDEDVPANSFLFDFTALDGKAKVALIKVNKQVVIFDSEAPAATYFDFSSISQQYQANKDELVVNNNTTKNLREFVLANGEYQDVTETEKALIKSSENLWWVPIVSADTDHVYFAAYTSDNKTGGDVQTSLIYIEGVYYTHHDKDAGYQGAISNINVSADGSDYALLTAINENNPYATYSNSNKGYWTIAK